MALSIAEDEDFVAACNPAGGLVARGHVVVALLCGDARKMRANIDPGGSESLTLDQDVSLDSNHSKSLNSTKK